MTTVQRVAQIFGVVFILVAVLGFVPAVGGSPTMEPDYLLGLFAVNAPHNVVHLLFGVWGLAAARSFGAAKTYAMAGGAIYLLLAVLGFMTPNLFGLVPIGGHNRWLHLVLGLGLAAAGFTARDAVVTSSDDLRPASSEERRATGR